MHRPWAYNTNSTVLPITHVLFMVGTVGHEHLEGKHSVGGVLRWKVKHDSVARLSPSWTIELHLFRDLTLYKRRQIGGRDGGRE